MNKSTTRGFIKASTAAGLTVGEVRMLCKQAFTSDQAISPNDMAQIRAALLANGADPSYENYSPEALRRYRADLLRKRDESLDRIPEVEGLLKGTASGLKGAVVGGVGGAFAGHYLKHSPYLRINPAYRTHLPTGLGATAAVLAGIISALPAAKHEYERTKSVKKLNAPSNIADVLQGNQTEQALLNS